MSLSRADIQQAFQNALGRQASQSDETAFLTASQNGTSDAQLFSAISNSQEANLNTDPVVRFYQAAFGRVPDQAGLDNATDYIRQFGASAQTYEALADMFARSPEFQARFGSGTGVTSEYVQALYTTILGRQATTAEIQGYVSGANGYDTRGEVLYAISQSNEAIVRTETSVNSFLLNAAEGDATYSGPLPGSSSGTPTQPIEPTQPTNPGTGGGGTPSVPTTFTLTTGVDTVPGTANADTIIGTVGVGATFTTADRIDGAGGTDTFNITVIGDGSNGSIAIPLVQFNPDTKVITPTVTNVEIFNIGNTSGQNATFNAAAIAGEQQVWNDQSTSGSVSVTGLATGAVIGVRGNTIPAPIFRPQIDATDTSFTYSSATDAVTIAVDGGVGVNTLFGPQGPNITRAQTGEATVTINSTGAANILGTIDLDNKAATITSVTINATTGLNAILSANDYATGAKLTLTGTALIDLHRGSLSAAITTIDTTGSTRGVDIRADNAADLIFTGGTGNDTLRLGATLTTADMINGGAGIDTVEITGDIYLDSSNATVQGIQKLANVEQIRFADVTTIDNNLVQSAITKLIFADGGDDVVQNAGTRTYVFQADQGNARFVAATNVKGGVVSDTLNLEFDRSAGTSFENTVAVEGHTTVAIATTGTSPFDQLNFDGISELRVAPGTIVNITGPNNFFLDRVTFNDSVSDPDRAIGVSINAQGSTGQTNIGGSRRSDTIVAGPGGGEISSRGGADDITLGAGTDTVNEYGDSRAQTGGTATHDTVRNFTAGTDKIGTFIDVQSVQQGTAYTAVGGGDLVQAIGNAINAGSATGLAANAAAIVTLTGTTNAGTYLVINDAGSNNAGYTAADSVIKLVGLTGALSTSDFVNQDRG